MPGDLRSSWCHLPHPPLGGLNVFPVVQIFFLRCHAAADMSLCLVDIEHFSCLPLQRRIDCRKTVGNVFMYRRFRYAKRFGSLPHGGIVFDDVIRDFDRALFDIFSHKITPALLCLYSLCRGIL